jgi:hypothetical protein
MAKNFIDFIYDVGKDGQLLADYVATEPTVPALKVFFGRKGKEYAITDGDLEKLAQAKKDSRNRLAFSQEAFTPLDVKTY